MKLSGWIGSGNPKRNFEPTIAAFRDVAMTTRRVPIGNGDQLNDANSHLSG